MRIMAERVCEQCGGTFGGVRARFCSPQCRTKRSRGEPPVAPRRARRRADYRIRERVRAELQAIGRESTALGLLALDLAGQMGDPELPAAGRVVLARELRTTLLAACEGARLPTGVDELKGRRDAKRGQARRRRST